MKRLIIKIVPIFIAILAVLLALLTGEYILKATNYKYKEVWWCWATCEETTRSKFVLDARRIYRLREDTLSHEENIPNYTNKEGFRSDSCLHEENIILFIGDSFTYGHGVKDDETFPYYFQELLQEDNQKTCVVNAGVQGYALAQEYIYLIDMLKKIKPTIVVWGFNTNDLSSKKLNSLISISKENIVIHNALFNGIYLQGHLAKTLGAVFPKSKLLNLIAYQLQADEFSKEYLNTWKQTLPLFIRHIHALSKTYNFTPYFILVPNREIIDDMAAPASNVLDEYHIYKQALQFEARFYDLNSVMINTLASLVPESEDVLGVSTDSAAIFLQDGHLSDTGNFTVSKILYNQIMR